MGKEKYTKEQVEFIVDKVNNGLSVTNATQQMCESFNIPYKESIGRNFRRRLQIKGITNNTAVEDTDDFKAAQKKEHDSTKKRFLVSWCQSDTEIHEQFLSNMEAYAKHIDADILITAGRYKNPTSLSASKNIVKQEKDKKNTWHQRVLPYLDANRHNLHKHLCLLSDVKIQPTASTPLSGMNSITGLESCILGHPRIHLKSLPVLEGYPHKLLVTTGAVSLENYTDTKIGKKSSFNHQIGCLVVELDGDVFHLRHIIADKKGDFYDLIYRVKSGEVKVSKKPVEALVFGDLHITHHSDECVDVSFSMAKELQPKKIVLHDIVDSHSISHHEKRNPFQLLQREQDGTWSLQKELDTVIDWFNKHKGWSYIGVRSNHCEFIDRWLMNEDWRKSNNKYLYLKFANLIAEGNAPKGIVPYILNKEVENMEALGIDDTYQIKSWEISQHGHIGVHGSRPSPIQWKNLPVKTIVGHSHVPHREDGHLSVGTLTHLRVGYNLGASAWLNSNVVIYPDGKATHLHIIKGRYTTLI